MVKTGQSQTFAFVKPDGVRRGLVGLIVSRIERKGLKLRALRLMRIDLRTAETLYAIHRGKPFYKELARHVSSGPICAMVVSGRNAVEVVRSIVGSTDPSKAMPGTIRGDLGTDLTNNIVHAADSAVSANRETRIIFGRRL